MLYTSYIRIKDAHLLHALQAENRPLKKRLQLKPVPIKKEPSNKVKMKICPKCSREFYRVN